MRLFKPPVSLGPGLLFAASAVGTSHLVQSTRAGADYGLTFIWVIVAITLLKYPVFRFASDYAASTGQTLVAGYAQRGRWLVILLGMAVLIEGIGAIAGVSLVTSGIAQTILGTQFPGNFSAAGLLILTAAIVLFSRYQVLENIIKVFVVVFSVCTVLATVSALPLLFELSSLSQPLSFSRADLSFMVAVSGWMPIGNVAALMLAAWVIARSEGARKQGGRQPQQAHLSVAAVRADFHLGYFATLFLALCFVVLGTATLLHSDALMPADSVGFAAMLLNLFTETLGTWSHWIIALTALAVMYSTLLAIVDGFPRLLLNFSQVFGWEWQSSGARLVATGLMVLAPGAVLLFFAGTFTALIDLITTTAFIIAPLIALGNHLLITSDEVAEDAQPAGWLRLYSWFCILALTAATGTYLMKL